MGFQFDVSFFLREIGVGFGFVPVVLLLSVVPLITGIVFGSLIAFIRLFKVPVLTEALTAVVVFIRGVPIILQLIVLYLAVNLSFDSIAHWLGLHITSKSLSYTLIALAGLSINAIVYLSEVVRTALQSVNAGQFEAAYSVGLTPLQTIRRIVIPQALPVAIPLLGSQFIGLIKGSSAASLISVTEVINGTLLYATQSYKFLEAYMASAVIYWVLCMLVERVTAWLEARTGFYDRGEAV